MEESLYCALIFSGALVVGTLPMTALLCRRQIAYKKTVSYLTMLEGCFIGTLFTMWLGCSVVKGWDIVSWLTEDGFPVSGWLVLWVWAISVSMLTSFAAVFFYRKRSKSKGVTH